MKNDEHDTMTILEIITYLLLKNGKFQIDASIIYARIFSKIFFSKFKKINKDK